jgi:hypothetical protein
MPNPEIEKLNKQSRKGQRSAAISDCIAREVRRGRDQEQAVAMCHEMARRKTGGSPPKEGE